MKALLLALALAVTAFAQKQPVQPCTLTIEQSPEVRALKLGQFHSARPRFAGRSDSDEPAELGVRKYSESTYSSDRFRGIDRISLIYLDDLLASLEIHYSSDVRWESAAHFAAAIAEQLKLPKTGWTDRRQPALVCDGFFVEVDAFGGGVLKIEKAGLEDEIAKRKAALEQKKRIEFKP